MKFSSVLATLSLLSSLALASPTPTTVENSIEERATTQYYLRVIGGNAQTNGRRLRFNGTNQLGLTLPPYKTSDLPVKVSPNAEKSQLFITPTQPHPGPYPTQLALVGASGHGLSSIKVGVNQGGRFEGLTGMGVFVGWDQWMIKRDQEHQLDLLRYKDDTCSSHWMAAQDTSGRWIVYWYQALPIGYNILQNPIPVDIQVIPAN